MTIKIWAFPAEADVIPMATLRVAATEHGHDKDINCLAVAPNDKVIASGSHDKTAKVDKRCLFHCLKVPPNRVLSVCDANIDRQ